MKLSGPAIKELAALVSEQQLVDCEPADAELGEVTRLLRGLAASA